MMQAPAAPQHELMVQEDGRDWALEQMSQAAAPGTAARAGPSTRRPLFEDISAGEGLECLLRGCSKWGPYSILSVHSCCLRRSLRVWVSSRACSHCCSCSTPAIGRVRGTDSLIFLQGGYHSGHAAASRFATLLRAFIVPQANSAGLG